MSYIAARPTLVDGIPMVMIPDLDMIINLDEAASFGASISLSIQRALQLAEIMHDPIAAPLLLSPAEGSA